MMRQWLFLLVCVLAASVDASEPETTVIRSDVDQLAALNSDHSLLIDGVVSALSGQPCLDRTDLIVKGAQRLSLHRFYLAPHIPTAFGGSRRYDMAYDASVASDERQRAYLYAFLNAYYQGWVVLPHLRLVVLKEAPLTVRLTESYGASCDLQVDDDGKTHLIGEPYGITNMSGHLPSGTYDLRNTCIAAQEGNSLIHVTSSEGIERIYRKSGSLHLLEKEVLLNGCVIRYSYDNTHLIKIESMDPHENHVYASIDINGGPQNGSWEFTANMGLTASYHYETRSESLKYRGEFELPLAGKNRNQMLTSPPLMMSATTPYCSKESMGYSNRYCLTQHQQETGNLTCHYGPFDFPDSRPYLRVAQLIEGRNSAPKYSLNYDVAIAGKKRGTTTAQCFDGSKLVYQFSDKLLIESIQSYHPNGQLGKQTTYHWNDQQWLQSVEVQDGNGSLCYQRLFEYDELGNPIVEVLRGDINGDGHMVSKTTYRSFSKDGKHLLLSEKNENGKTTRWDYLPNTNLPTAVLKSGPDGVIERQFFEYNDSHQLVRKIIDNGSQESKDALLGVTQRIITEYILRQQQPFLHMPEWIEEKFLDQGVEKLLSKRHLVYDRYGNVCQEEFFDGDREHLYTLFREYNERGDLLSETNALGQKTTYQYDDKGNCICFTNSSQRLLSEMQYDELGRKTLEQHTGEGITPQVTQLSYDLKGRLIQKIDEYGNHFEYEYDPPVDRVTKTKSPSIILPDGASIPVVTTSTYDVLGREKCKTDANGNSTHYEYNAIGLPTTITYPDPKKRFAIQMPAY